MKFRTKLWLTLILSVALVTGATLYFAQSRIEQTYRSFHRQQFQQHQRFLSRVRQFNLARLRRAAGKLASSVRLIAALEQGDKELIYENAFSELSTIMTAAPPGAVSTPGGGSNRTDRRTPFFRLVDPGGNLVSTMDPRAGPGIPRARRAVDRRLRTILSGSGDTLPERETGFFQLPTGSEESRLYQIVMTEIVDPYDRDVMGHLVLGFPFTFSYREEESLRTGLWVSGELVSRSITGPIRDRLRGLLTEHSRRMRLGEHLQRIESSGVPYLVFWEPLNTESLFPPVYEVALFSLEDSVARQRELRYGILGFGAVALLAVLLVGTWMVRTLSGPLDELLQATEQLGAGNYDVDVEEPGEPEFRQLARSFNRMTREIRSSREEMIEAREYTENILGSMMNALVVVKPDGTVDRVNAALLDLTGYEESELVGTTVNLILAGETRFEDLNLQERIRTGEARNLEVQYRSSGGTEVPMLFSASALRGPDGEIQEFVCVAQDITERKEAQHRMLHDSLTGLPNRGLFRDRLDDRLEGYRAGEHDSLALVYLDLDQFELIHESLGLKTGDDLLKAAADRIRDGLPGDVELARLGRDDFAVLLVNRSERDVKRFVRSLVNGFEEPFILEGRRVHSGLNVGLVFPDREDESSESLLRDAHTAMSQARESGADFEVFDPARQERVQQRQQMQTALRTALQNREFTPYYQPIVDAGTEDLVGFEALLRWYPEGEEVPPGDFIPVAEETGSILQIGRDTRRKAFRELARWGNELEEGEVPRLGLNLSTRELEDDDLPARVEELLEEFELDPERIKFEITESSLMEQNGVVRRVLDRVQSMGVALSIDDFGTGYSSLNQLQAVPFDELKVDRTFVQALHADNGDGTAIVKTILNLAQNLDVPVVAEGVESEDQLSFLRSLGCDYVQGFYFGRAVPSEQALPMVKRGRVELDAI